MSSIVSPPRPSRGRSMVCCKKTIQGSRQICLLLHASFGQSDVLHSSLTGTRHPSWRLGNLPVEHPEVLIDLLISKWPLSVCVEDDRENLN